MVKINSKIYSRRRKPPWQPKLLDGEISQRPTYRWQSTPPKARWLPPSALIHHSSSPAQCGSAGLRIYSW